MQAEWKEDVLVLGNTSTFLFVVLSISDRGSKMLIRTGMANTRGLVVVYVRAGDYTDNVPYGYGKCVCQSRRIGRRVEETCIQRSRLVLTSGEVQGVE